MKSRLHHSAVCLLCGRSLPGGDCGPHLRGAVCGGTPHRALRSGELFGTPRPARLWTQQMHRQQQCHSVSLPLQGACAAGVTSGLVLTVFIFNKKKAVNRVSTTCRCWTRCQTHTWVPTSRRSCSSSAPSWPRPSRYAPYNLFRHLLFCSLYLFWVLSNC